MRYVAISMLVWISLGLIGSGFDNAYFQRNLRWRDLCHGRQAHANAVAFGIIGGPVALFASFFASGYGQYGWSLAIDAEPSCIK